MSTGKGVKIRNMLLLEDDLKKEVTINGDTFTVKAITGSDQKQISRNVAIETGGVPANSLSMDARMMFERDAALDHALVDYPDWWENADKCPDEDLKNRLYEEINSWSLEFQERLKKNRFARRGPETQVLG